MYDTQNLKDLQHFIHVYNLKAMNSTKAESKVVFINDLILNQFKSKTVLHLQLLLILTEKLCKPDKTLCLVYFV